MRHLLLWMAMSGGVAFYHLFPCLSYPLLFWIRWPLLLLRGLAHIVSIIVSPGTSLIAALISILSWRNSFPGTIVAVMGVVTVMAVAEVLLKSVLLQKWNPYMLIHTISVNFRSKLLNCRRTWAWPLPPHCLTLWPCCYSYMHCSKNRPPGR